MQTRQKFFFLLALVSLLYTIVLITDTYAKYRSEANATADMKIARWNILVNEQDIKRNSDFSATIVPTFTGTQHIASDVIAPTSEGYFDIVVDGTNADVSYSSTLHIAVSEASDVTDLQITDYTVNGGTSIPVTNTSLNVNTNVYKNDSNKRYLYRFYIKWVDGGSETMDNAADTAATINGTAAFEVNASFTQIAS